MLSFFAFAFLLMVHIASAFCYNTGTVFAAANPDMNIRAFAVVMVGNDRSNVISIGAGFLLDAGCDY